MLLKSIWKNDKRLFVCFQVMSRGAVKIVDAVNVLVVCYRLFTTASQIITSCLKTLRRFSRLNCEVQLKEAPMRNHNRKQKNKAEMTKQHVSGRSRLKK